MPALPAVATLAPRQRTATLKVPMIVVHRSKGAKHAARRICPRLLATAASTILPVDGTFTNSCTGEQVVVTGTQNMVVNTVVDANGKGHVYIQDNWQRTSGVALVTGTKYSANDSTHSFELVSNGPTPNMIIRSKIEMVVDANGVPVDFRAAQVTADCRG